VLVQSPRPSRMIIGMRGHGCNRRHAEAEGQCQIRRPPPIGRRGLASITCCVRYRRPLLLRCRSTRLGHLSRKMHLPFYVALGFAPGLHSNSSPDQSPLQIALDKMNPAIPRTALRISIDSDRTDLDTLELSHRLISAARAAAASHPIQRKRVIPLLQIRMLAQIALHRRVIGEHLRTALSVFLKGQVMLR
jgi:hypothetical protein